MNPPIRSLGSLSRIPRTLRIAFFAYLAGWTLLANPPAHAYDVADGATWTDTSGTDSAILLGSATLGANNSVINLSLRPTASSGKTLAKGSFSSVTLSGTLSGPSSNVTYSLTPNLIYSGTGPLLLNMTTGQLTLSGTITATNGLTRSSGGVLVISSNNSATLSGTVILNGGTTSMLGGNGRLSSSVDLQLNNSAVFNLQDGNDTTVNTVTLNGGSITLGGTNQATASLTASSFSLNKGTVNAHLVGTAATLTKSTADSVTLAGTNTYTGATAITGGTLLLSGTGSINSTSGVSVTSGATLQNDSSVAFTRDLTLAEGAILSGTGAFAPTALALTANLADGFTTFALGMTSLTKAGNLELTLTGLTTGSYTLFSGSALTGSFSSITIGGVALDNLGGGDFSGLVAGSTYSFTNSNNLLNVTAIPEPTTAALILISGAIFWAGNRRMRRE